MTHRIVQRGPHGHSPKCLVPGPSDDARLLARRYGTGAPTLEGELECCVKVFGLRNLCDLNAWMVSPIWVPIQYKTQLNFDKQHIDQFEGLY